MQLATSNIDFFDCPLYTGRWEQYDLLFGHNQGSICRFLEQSADQMACVACYVLYILVRVCDKSHLTPHRGMYTVLID